eukprot:4280547-Prymnesium_polylepis.1
MVPATGTVSYEASLAGTGVHWAFSTCEWLTACDKTGAKTESVGSKCTVTRDAQTLTGFCFESSTGSLECGRLIETTDKYNTATQMTDSLQRCPRGLAATSIGTWVGKRLLMGGCMLANDANYTKHAEVHVPQLCYLPYDYKTGCMFPGATNYDPQAIQPGNCHYNIAGCTDSTAVNYNSEAYTDDGSCIAVVSGCTVKSSTTSYTGVDTDTPDYQTRYFGRANRAIGLVTQTAYAAVLNYNSNANVNHGCVVAIEGCMDSLAVNYDPYANVNSNTWCIPAITGCMMPPYLQASTNFNGMGAKTHYHDGGAANFNPAATVHVPSDRAIERYGCTDSTAANYDPHATVQTTCYTFTGGCLESTALNFNCTALAVGSTILTTACTADSPRATYHSADLCNFNAEATSVEQTVPAEGSGDVTTEILASGSVEDYDTIRLDGIASTFATEVGFNVADTSAAVSAASVKISITCLNVDAGTYANAAKAIKAKFGSLEAIK